MRGVVVCLLAVCSAVVITREARADLAPPSLFVATEAPEPPPLLQVQPIRVDTYGLLPPARVILFPSVAVVRPADIPPPKPTKGLGLVFNW